MSEHQTTSPADAQPAPLAAADTRFTRASKTLDKLFDDLKSVVVAESAALVSERDAALAGIRALPSHLSLRDKMLLEAERDYRAQIDAIQEQVVAAFRAVERERLEALAPVRTVTVSVPRERSGVSSTTADDTVILSADGHEYRRETRGRAIVESELADDVPCGLIGCRFCVIAQQAGEVKSYGGYRMMLTKAISQLTSEFIESHRACMHHLAYAGLVAYPKALQATLYVPTSR